MGGSSGGGGWGGASPEDLGEALRAAKERTVDAVYEVECAEYLNSLLPLINNRDADLVNRRLDEVAAALERKLDGELELLLGGSVSKHTYVDGLSDVDALVLVDNTELADSSPAKVQGYMAQRLRARFREIEVKVGQLAITLDFPDISIQLLPALREGDRIRIADASGQRWAEIRPREFARVLTAVNQEQGGKVVPTIKLAKSLLAGLPEQHRLSGYHVESLAVDVFRGYAGPRTLRAMLRHFFDTASQRVLTPIVDRTGQSVHVDDDLGPQESMPRQLRSAALSRVARRLAAADAAGDVGIWRSLLED